MFTWTRVDLTTLDTGRIRARWQTNDDNDDGYPDGEISSYDTYHESIGQAIKRCGKSRKGFYGQPVDVFLDGNKI